MTSKRKGGRPKKDVDLAMVEALGKLHVTQAELSSVLKISVATVERRLAEKGDFYEAFEKGKAEGKISLRRKQWQQAHDGDKTMLIWLGKQILGQAEKSKIHEKHEHSGPNGKPIDIKVVRDDFLDILTKLTDGSNNTSDKK
jgi:hypothetical protein